MNEARTYAWVTSPKQIFNDRTMYLSALGSLGWRQPHGHQSINQVTYNE